ncbi:unnamed protein product [Lactuca virosa]|uniref:Uncharacterized protein n=1 Tax=Lactuca virosa TaxID=75947 RepID=A0AAU9N1L1_9ASTR|nr:unnamed protein product [Lactuca virosa]
MASRGARGSGRSGSHIGGRDVGDRNASQSHNNAESQPSSSVRGSNILEQVQISVIRDIICILKTMFDGPWTSWKKVDKEHRDAMWEHFKGLYVWPEETDVLARKVWEDCMKKRFPDTTRRTREESFKLAQAANEAYESAMVAKFGYDTSFHPLLDNETWCDVSGGVNKGRIYGFRYVSDPTSFLEGTSSFLERVRNEMRGEMDAKGADMEAEHQQMREEMDAKVAAIDAKQQQIDAKYEAMEKMYAAMQNMMGN